MRSILNFQFLLPIAILLLQLFIILFACIALLRKAGIIKRPLGGLEYSHAIFATVTIFSVFLIGTASGSPLFQTFKTYQNQGNLPWQIYLSKSGEFFLVILFFEILLGTMILLFTKTFLSVGIAVREIREGIIPASLITSAIVLGFAIVLREMAAEVLGYITPQYINFR